MLSFSRAAETNKQPWTFLIRSGRRGETVPSLKEECEQSFKKESGVRKFETVSLQADTRMTCFLRLRVECSTKRLMDAHLRRRLSKFVRSQLKPIRFPDTRSREDLQQVRLGTFASWVQVRCCFYEAPLLSRHVPASPDRNSLVSKLTWQCEEVGEVSDLPGRFVPVQVRLPVGVEPHRLVHKQGVGGARGGGHVVR